MFKIKANPTFPATVQVPTPEGDMPLSLVFKHKSRKEMTEYFERVAQGGSPTGQALGEIVAGWADVDAEFSEQAIEDLTENYQGAVQAIYSAYLTALTQAKLKN